MKDDLNEVFNIEVVEPVRRAELVTVDGRSMVVHDKENVDNNVEADYEIARTNLHSIIEQGGELLQKAIVVALESEAPMSIDTAAALITRMADVNEKLLALSEKRLKLQRETGHEDGPSSVTNNNALVVCTTAEILSRILKGKGEE